MVHLSRYCIVTNGLYISFPFCLPSGSSSRYCIVTNGLYISFLFCLPSGSSSRYCIVTNGLYISFLFCLPSGSSINVEKLFENYGQDKSNLISFNCFSEYNFKC